ncbi:hypothetical protein PSACC_02724 [Paramicrosporidium saccamoebae]|uniref:Ubiquitin-like modifier-activating enzyme Atg7 N-terminal domain-containing protein n=1 Tax=Paramicrosporidium saccamoebae TaxID=1246581 RepID=A0A2H9TIC9_9FUNG|nr:hypothetical protein PSACC_02724 [Paramicrosporidium saccamoebae]
MEGQLRFAPFTSAISVSFWTSLARKKINEWKLDDGDLAIWGYYEAGVQNRSPRLHITEECLEGGQLSSSKYIEPCAYV